MGFARPSENPYKFRTTERVIAPRVLRGYERESIFVCRAQRDAQIVPNFP